MPINRRQFLAAAGAAASSLGAGPAAAAPAPLPLRIAVRSPWMANQVALTHDDLLFLGLPRYARDRPTPSLARRAADGTLAPFPGNAWNAWQPGDDGRNAFVYLNAVHVFADDTVWCVDQGSLAPGIFPGIDATLDPAAQKLVRLDARSGRVIEVLRFDATILPPGAQMNDLRFHRSMLYISDSGLGGLIVHDRATGRTMRRLSALPVTQASPAAVPAILAHVKGSQTFHPPDSDLIEITADGRWLYWASPTGPVRRIETRWLDDPSLTDADLVRRVEHVHDNRFAGGCAMDSAGNLYLCETITRHITLLAPDGRTAVLASDPTLIRPDGAFISRDRRLYIPIKQPVEDAAHPDAPPFAIYAIDLPAQFGTIALGSAVTGA
ncbi:SMP-30/gluconolactonase/LRE family protein [Burkholderia perseverans]|uniref:SMP-30/gluconolactonase/LRE family protein n=1 Tax=Burkholderia perseverans TaxID=2615214 RepID=UPI001FEFBFB5|nr:major royal jelly family protein [Burkholderia perseverans]